MYLALKLNKVLKGQPFYVVIGATRMSSRLYYKDSSFIISVILRP